MVKMTQSEIDRLSAEASGEIARLTSNLSSMQRRIDKLQGINQGENMETPVNERIKVDRKNGTIRTV